MLITPQELRRRARSGKLLGDGRQVINVLYYLSRKGLIKYVDKNNERFIKLTAEGQLEALLAKAKLPDVGQWDGKWRVIMFDIPEDSRDNRNFFRRLLKMNGYKQLQASVFINPYPLNREAVKYLKEKGLMNYIRILKVEELDDDAGLKKHFGLK